MSAGPELSAFEQKTEFFEEVRLGKTHVKPGEGGRFCLEIIMPFFRKFIDVLQKRIAFSVVQEGSEEGSPWIRFFTGADSFLVLLRL